MVIKTIPRNDLWIRSTLGWSSRYKENAGRHRDLLLLRKQKLLLISKPRNKSLLVENARGSLAYRARGGVPG